MCVCVCVCAYKPCTTQPMRCTLDLEPSPPVFWFVAIDVSFFLLVSLERSIQQGECTDVVDTFPFLVSSSASLFLLTPLLCGN
ncbi:hypothetical protein IOCL1545_000625000 [Leishmania shawi]|uniref:Secreted protein n=1 Tax=Leishmania shawi TaxID=5680 RepID=A0ABR3E1J3_9TRYP